MWRRGLMILGIAGLLGTSGLAAQERPRTQAPAGNQLAQVCGWFAIYHCSRSVQEASRFASNYRGFLIDSSDARLPNFAPGWYCVVDGPTSRDQAMSSAGYARRDGHHTAYAKNSC